MRTPNIVGRFTGCVHNRAAFVEIDIFHPIARFKGRNHADGFKIKELNRDPGEEEEKSRTLNDSISPNLDTEYREKRRLQYLAPIEILEIAEDR